MNITIDAASPQATVACIGCGGLVPATSGPTHPYMRSSPGCWWLYGELGVSWRQGDEETSAALGHQVDAYAVQHPGGAEHDRRQRQSVAVHLIALCRLLEGGVGGQRASRERGRTSEVVLARLSMSDWPYLTPPHTLGAVTVVDVQAAPTPSQQQAGATAWLESAWAAWAEHHETVRTWAGAMQRMSR